MKIKNILISGLGVLALTGCNDYLDVDAPSKYTTDYVYSTADAANLALNGLYTKVLSDNAWGKAFVETLCFNTDVDFKSISSDNSGSNNIRRFDCDATSSTANSVWNQCYAAIDAANVFIYNVENGDLLESSDSTEVWQMLGEAKCIRAMFYHELVNYWGDVPAPFIPTVESENQTPAIQSRDDINFTIVKDLCSVAENMKSAKDLGSVERFSKEACYALVARIALQAGGYSLRHNDGDATSYGYMARPTATKFTDLIDGEEYSGSADEFYKTARAAALEVINSGTFALTKTFQQVFTDECNFKGIADFDDPIMEIPFAKEASGQVGYLTGPKCASNNSSTDHNWGEAGGSLNLNWFYPYSFDSDDTRGAYLQGMWQYTYQGVPSFIATYYWYNNKWSKLWNDEGLGSDKSTSTGINYPYLRYADVLLMFAEADNAVNGPTQDAVDAINIVRERAYQSAAHNVAAIPASKEEMLDTILAERAKEFAGENLRWKDLARNNRFAEATFWNFMTYYGFADQMGGSGAYGDMVCEHVGDEHYLENLPTSFYSCYIQNPGISTFYPQTSKALYVMYYAKELTYKISTKPQTYIDGLGLGYTVVSQHDINSALNSTSVDWNESTLGWDNNGIFRGEIRNSYFGYIRADENGNFFIVNNGQLQSITPTIYDTKNLPTLRYLLPIPREAITRSNGAYQNYYGY